MFWLHDEQPPELAHEYNESVLTRVTRGVTGGVTGGAGRDGCGALLDAAALQGVLDALGVVHPVLRTYYTRDPLTGAPLAIVSGRVFCSGRYTRGMVC